MSSVPGRLTRAAPLVAWLCAGAALAGSVVAVLLLADADQPHATPWKSLVLPAVWAVPGALIAAGRPRSPIGWLMLAVAMLFVGAGLSQAWVAHTAGPAAGAAWAVWFTDRGSAFLVPCGLLTLLLLPDGRLPSRRWRLPVAGVLGVQCAALVAFNLVRGPAAGPDSSFPARVLSLANPVGVLPPGVGDLISGYDVLLLQVPLLLGPLGFLVKLRNAVGAERTRIVGVLLAATVFVLTVVLGHALWPAASDVLDIAGSLVFATVLTASVLGRRLDQVDFAVHHTFVYAVLTVLVAVLYVAVASLASQWGASLPPFGAGVVAALLALALLPLRARLQGAVGRLMYGDRADPYHALSRLAESTHAAPSPHNVLVELATSISRSLRVPWVFVRAGDLHVEQGRRPVDGTEWTAPLLSGGNGIGTVQVAADATRRVSDDDRRLLADLGRHGGLAVHAALLTETVRASRQRLVAAREEERRRIGRDLHDGLGPTVAGIAMQLGALRRIVHVDPETTADRLALLEEAARGALEQVRSTARQLRPSALDQVGLEEAVRQVADSLGVTLDWQGALPEQLPAAVEVAAYRVATEALTNVARHARTDAAALVVAAEDGFLRLSVSDRGTGFPAGSPVGVGLPAMRERVEELGGSFDVCSVAGDGTRVTATLPCDQRAGAPTVVAS